MSITFVGESVMSCDIAVRLSEVSAGKMIGEVFGGVYLR